MSPCFVSGGLSGRLAESFPVFRVSTLVGVMSLFAFPAAAQDPAGLRAGTAAVAISPTVFPIQREATKPMNR